MNWLESLPVLVGGSSAGTVLLGLFIRKLFVSWSSDNVSIRSNDTTATMMENFHSEIKRLADSNAEFAKENAHLRKQISRLEAILEKLAVKFNVDLKEFEQQ